VNFMSHASPLPAILILHMIRCRGCGQAWTGEELDTAGIRVTAGHSPCGCTCTDPSDPRYEDWVIDHA
jgi:hypothetical protein